MTWICARCKKAQTEPENKAAIAIYDDGTEEKICSPCIMATLGPDNEEW